VIAAAHHAISRAATSLKQAFAGVARKPDR
jgi:hypothetical protein